MTTKLSMAFSGLRFVRDGLRQSLDEGDDAIRKAAKSSADYADMVMSDVEKARDLPDYRARVERCLELLSQNRWVVQGTPNAWKELHEALTVDVVSKRTP